MINTIQKDHKAGFYLIAHGCNNLKKIDKAYRQKANGLECDLWADENKKWWVSHDGNKKVEPVEWLTYIEKAEQKFNRKLSIIVFDIKSAEPLADIRNIIISNLPQDLCKVYSTATLEKAEIFSEIVPLLKANEVIAIDEEDNCEKADLFFKRIGAVQCWYGNGISITPLDGQYHDSMKNAALLRNSSASFSKIYTWSIHRKESLRKYVEEDKVDALIVGLNGFFTKPISNALKILKANNITLADRNNPLF